MTVATDHDVSLKSRAEELEALAVAKKAIVESTSGAEQQQYGAASFLQLDGIHHDGSLMQFGTGNSALIRSRGGLHHFELVTLIRSLAKKYKEQALAQLAGRIASQMRISATM